MTATPFNQRTIDAFHKNKGRQISMWGDNLLLLTAKGARSGREIVAPLVYRRRGDRYIVVASKGGAPDHPKWYGNIRKYPIVGIEVAKGDTTERFTARATAIPSGPEHDELYRYMTEVWPGFADYQRRTSRTIPIVVLDRISGQAEGPSGSSR